LEELGEGFEWVHTVSTQGELRLSGTLAEYAHKARHGFRVSTVLCVAFNPDHCTYAGTKGGHVYKFEEDGVKALRKYDNVHQVRPSPIQPNRTTPPQAPCTLGV
jgi:hypothetical protein